MTKIVHSRHKTSTLLGTPRRNAPARSQGFTLLEVSIYIAVLGILAAPISMMALGVTRSTAESNLIGKVLERNRAALHRITSDFRQCLDGTVTITGSGTVLSFTLPGAFNGTGPAGGNIIRYEIQDDSTDANNGSDDNGNGVADEKILVRINQTTSETVTVSSSLDPARSSFTANGDGVTVTLTTFGRANGSQIETEMTQTVVLFPRN